MRFLFCSLALLGAGAMTLRAQPPAWVTIKGQVVPPANVPLPVPKALALGGAQGCPANLKDEGVVVNPKTRGIKNVVVWLRPNNTNPKAALAATEVHPADARRLPKAVEIDQPCCLFEPRVLAARVGDMLVVKNSAAIGHNFLWTSANNGELNVTLPAKGKHVFAAPLVAEAGPVRYSCTIHPWMAGYVRVFDHPYYAVTDDDGRFEIKDAPAGAYRLVYWHETGFKGKAAGRFGDPVRVAPGKDGPLALPPTEFDVR